MTGLGATPKPSTMRRMPYSPDTDRMERKGLIRRITSLGIDIFALVLLTMPGMAAEAYFHPTASPTPAQHVRWSLVSYGFWLCYTSFEFLSAASLGKFLLKLKIANADSTPATTSTLFLRWSTKWSFLIIGAVALAIHAPVLQWLANLMCFIVLLGCLPALGDNGITWHDRWSRTAVFRVRRLRQQRGFEPLLNKA